MITDVVKAVITAFKVITNCLKSGGGKLYRSQCKVCQ